MNTNYTKEDIEKLTRASESSVILEGVCNLDYMKANLQDATLAVSRFLLLPSNLRKETVIKMRNETNTPYEQWFDELKKKQKVKHKATMAGRWMLGSGLDDVNLSLYCIFLFNIDFGKTRSLFEKFLMYDNSPPPYLDLVLVNILHQGLKLSHTEASALLKQPFANVAKHLNQLFSSESTIVEDWLSRKRQNLRFYGGATNTVLGLYDRFFNNEAVGTQFLNRNAEGRYDLGGGFNTSEIERLVGKSFVSADILSPNILEHDPEIVIQKIDENKKLVIVDTETQKKHIEQQSKIQYLKFNVLKDSFPKDKGSYLITSTGFTTSTVRPNGLERSEKKGGQGHLLLSVHAIQRVIELVKEGKAVDFFTIQRATNRAYRYKTCLIQWREGRAINIITTDDKEKKRWSEETIKLIYERIQPDNQVFREYSKL